jgi:hypothetical protein
MSKEYITIDVPNVITFDCGNGSLNDVKYVECDDEIKVKVEVLGRDDKCIVTYELISVIYYNGTNHILNSSRTRDRKWYIFDDDNTVEIAEVQRIYGCKLEHGGARLIPLMYLYNVKESSQNQTTL